MVSDELRERFDVELDKSLLDVGEYKIAKLYGASITKDKRAELFDLPSEVYIEPRWVNTDRERGIFTERDREYLMESDEYEGQTEREIRYRIRNRLTNLYYDSFYADMVSEDDLEATFDSIGESSPFLAYWLFRFGLKSIRAAVDNESDFRDNFYERCIEAAIQDIEGDSSHSEASTYGGVKFKSVSASAEIEIERVEFDGGELREKIVQGNATQKEFETYWKFGIRKRLVDEAVNEGKEEIKVADSMGIPVTYHVENLRENIPRDDNPDGNKED